MSRNVKGFTLIELLAVIVILAIIAIIATPIILGIINNSKNMSDKRSIELYASAVKNAVASYQLKNPEDSEITLEKIKDYIKYNGNKVECDTTNINTDGTIYLAGCKVDGKEVEYAYGKEGLIDGPSVPTPVSFEEDSWATIVASVKAGNISAYNVGDTKEVDLGELGTHTLRIANTSTPEECNGAGFSQTACGFVLEFADIINEHVMNSTATNVGGWEASEMRTYVNETIYNSLPSEIKNNIINTYVVSGHGEDAETTYTTTDKLYLLSTKEVWGKEGTSNQIEYDTAEAETRQLDYYKSIGVTTDNYSGTIKTFDGSDCGWWLRSAFYTTTTVFYFVFGDSWPWWMNNSNISHGVAPAFRIG